MIPTLSSETIHATAVAIDGWAVLLWGRSGAGKSDLALRLIDRGARLISDDYTLLKRSGQELVASAPTGIAGRMEVRGLGILGFETVTDVPVALLAVLDEPVERMPEEGLSRRFAGCDVPAITLGALEPSAPIKVELALKRLGLTR